MALSLDGTTGISASGNITGGNIVTAGSLTVGSFLPTTVSASGNVTGGNIITTGTISVTGNIVSTGSNAVANIGSASTYFNTAHVKATSAQYADVAEIYESDIKYAPGTVVEFGGGKEVTISRKNHSTKIAGVVSTNPAYLMNATYESATAIQIGLLGRVPCQVVGPITKGDRLVASDIPGVAQALDIDLYQPGCIIGKALENHNSTDVGVIEVVVGRL